MAAAVLALAVTAAASTATAATESTPGSPDILALGDSVAFGMGSPVPGEGGFAAILARSLCDQSTGCEAGEVVNLAVPGATSDDVRRNQVPQAAAILTAQEDPVTLVILTVGGNDLFNRLLTDCRSGLTAGCRLSMGEVFATVGDNLAGILAELRRAAGPDVPIVTMTYYNPLAACALAPLHPTAQRVLEGGLRPSGFNDLIRVTAAATDTRIAEVSGRLSTAEYVGGFDCIHPNADGHAAIAEAFVAALEPPRS